MTIAVSLTDFSLKYRKPLWFGNHLYTHRKGLFVELRLGERSGVGEIAPLESVNSESLDEVIKQTQNLSCEILPEYFPSVRFALESAQFDLEGRFQNPMSTKTASLYIPGCDLDRSDSTVLKIKVGRQSVENDIKVLRDLLNNSQVKIRLDGNLSMTFDDCHKLLSSIDTERVEFFEEPFLGLAHYESLYHKFGVPVAIDETLSDFIEKLEQIPMWCKYAILKPTVFGSLSENVALIDSLLKLDINPVISSPFVTCVGMKSLVWLSNYVDRFIDIHHGLDTLKYFESDSIDEHIFYSEGEIHVT